jgi:ABC-type branched-subunit amino acid transport system ATPase component/ABC-type branched-subunit amino acid transport system permease subunit
VNTFVQFLAVGLGTGAMYATAALGIVVVHRGSGVVNFAHGGFAIIGAFVYAEVVGPSFPPLLALVVAVAASAAAGALFFLVVMKRMQEASPLARVVATLGLLTAIQAAANLHYGDVLELVPSVLPRDGVHVVGVVVTLDSILLLGISAVVAAGLWAVWRFTTFGVVTSAAAESERAAAALGRSPATVAMRNWAIGCGMAGAAGVLAAPIIGLSVQTVSLLLFPCLAAALVGNFSSFGWTWGGALLLGVAGAEITNYAPQSRWSTAGPLLAVIAVLAIRGKALPVRGFLAERLPDVGTGRVRPLALVITIVAAGAITLALGASSAQAVGTSAVAGIVCLSITVVAGYAGQLSLAQYSIAGCGTLVAANISAHWHVPFVVALLAAVVVTVPAGVLLATPALRIRGVSLAIITLCLALCAEFVLFGTPRLTGGLQGLTVDTPGIAGLTLDPVTHAQRYALLCLLVFAVVGLGVANLRRSGLGRRLVAVRANERAAMTLGISVVRAKLLAFAIAAGIAALGGGLIAFQTPVVRFTEFTALASVSFVVIAAIGGIGVASGSIVAAIAASSGIISFEIGQAVDSTQWLLLVTGVIVMLNMVLSPDGVVLDAVRKLARRKLTATAQEAASEAPAVRRASGRKPGALTVLDVSKSYGAAKVLDGVSVEVTPGRVVGLIGPNGAGKTTLIDVISGLTRPDRGSVSLDGADVGRLSAPARARLGLVRSFQSLELFDELTVRENLAVAAEPTKSSLVELVRPRDVTLSQAAAAAVDELGLLDLLDRRPGELSYGQRRLVAIARAVAADPAVLLLDEPAAGLDDAETAELGRILRRLAEDWNLAVLLVEHNVNLVMGVSDEIVTLNFGRVIARGTPQGVRADPAVVEAYLGERADADAGTERVAAPAAQPAEVPGALAARGLSAGYGARLAVRKIDLVVRPGEVVALLGANGAGKTTTLLALCGALSPAAGEVLWKGEAVHDDLAHRARRGLGLVPEERGVFSRLTVADNLRVGQGEPEAALALFPELRPLMQRNAGLLSGGEQQMLALGRALAAKPSVLLIDELSLGLAPTIVNRLLTAIQDAAATGLAILLVEQHVRTALAVADRGYVLQRGEVALQGSGAELRDSAEDIERVYLSTPTESPRQPPNSVPIG